jgi:hypothetical protein
MILSTPSTPSEYRVVIKWAEELKKLAPEK